MPLQRWFLWLLVASFASWLTACGDDGSHHSPDMTCDGSECEPADKSDASGDDSEDASGEGDAEPAVSDASYPLEVDAAVAEDAAADAGADASSAAPDAMSDGGSDASTSADGGDAASSDARVADAAQDASVTPDASGTPDAGTTFVPVRFSATDHGASAFLSPDRLRVENRGEDHGNARSDALIAPGSGVFYFEAERLIDSTGFWGVGVATAAASLTEDLGATSNSLGILTHGEFADSGATCTGSATFDATITHYGLVIDYRTANPRILYVLDNGAGGAEIRRTCSTAITGALYVFYAGVRYEVGYQLKINTGADTVNHPFHYGASQVTAALVAASETQVSAAIVFGFGKTRALPLSASPLLSAPLDRSVTAGTSVTLTGTASDAEDGNLTSSITWTDLSAQHHWLDVGAPEHAQVTGTGGSFTFTAALGRHPVIMSVTDSVGRTTEHTVMVTATGTLPQASAVRMVGPDPSDPLTGTDITLSADGLQVDVHASTKKGVRANQGIYGQYWYFEAHRNGVPNNEGVGLIIPDGSLNPYDFINVPWSMSINLTGSTWYNLNSIDGWTAANNHYGFAVDYRGEHPIVHVIIGGALHHTLVMKDVWGPIYPMVYGNPFYAPPDVDPGYDITVNFGASAFAYNPATILGLPAGTIKAGWGVHAPP